MQSSGRHAGFDLLYAREIGISKRQVQRMGGAEHLRALSINHPETWHYVISLAKNPTRKAGIR